MDRKSSIVRAASSLIAPALLISVLNGSTAFGQSPPDVVYLQAIIRDFRSSHADFNVVPHGGNGHFAGNMLAPLSSNNRPQFDGTGNKVTSQWLDDNGSPIPPHLYAYGMGSSNEILTAEPTPPGKHGDMDTWDSRNGPYGSGPTGPAPTVTSGAEMPTISVPRSLSSMNNQGNVSYNGNKTISSDIHCDQMYINGTVTIEGNIKILCEDVFAMDNGAIIELAPGAYLSVYLMQGASSWNHVEINKNTQQNHRVVFYNASTQPFLIHNHAEVYATIISPNAEMEISNHGAAFGRFVGKRIEFGNHGDYHQDVAPTIDFCGNELADSAGSSGVSSTGGITSALTFQHWYNDVMGINLSNRFSLEMIKNNSGVYEFLDDAFFPIDGEMLGNEGRDHNYYFTVYVPITFTHRSCDDRFFEFLGADDAWLYVDGTLAMDLGGVLPSTSQYVELDRLGLNDGQTYQMHFFYAQRNPSSARFRMRTNADLHSDYEQMTVSQGFD